jgi:hypothetical protein
LDSNLFFFETDIKQTPSITSATSSTNAEKQRVCCYTMLAVITTPNRTTQAKMIPVANQFHPITNAKTLPLRPI